MYQQQVTFKDLGKVGYKQAWDYQESLLQETVGKKIKVAQTSTTTANHLPHAAIESTNHYLLFCEHPPVYTLGKSGSESNILISKEQMELQHIEFFKTNRGGDITFHGPGQIVGYPILDLEKFYTDIGRYLRELEEVIIMTLADFNISGQRSKGETGVWIDSDKAGKERKICAMGVRCSRWVTMHGFALNVNTDLNYFNHIIPCGIQNKKVTSMQQELNYCIDEEEVKEKIRRNFERVFQVNITE